MTFTSNTRVMSSGAAAEARRMLRRVVTEGTASFGEVPGYAVGGKTGTADKPRENGGGYYDDKVIATFASAFPIEDPQYVLVVSLDEPEERTGPKPRRTAGWTAVPVAAEVPAGSDGPDGPDGGFLISPGRLPQDTEEPDFPVECTADRSSTPGPVTK